MVERFLRYSLEHGRPIALMISDEKGLRRINLTVSALDEEYISYTSSRSKKERTLPRACILSAAYARGDEGDTLKNELKHEKK